MLADAQAMVFVKPLQLEPRVYGCVFGHRGVTNLGAPSQCVSPGGCAGISLERLAGTVVGFELSSTPGLEGNGASYAIVVVDLRTGRRVHKVPTGVPKQPKPGILGIGPAQSLAVKSDGAVGWIVDANREDGSRQVRAVDASGERTLAAGPEIDDKSLALTGSTLYWLEGGAPMSAVLH